MALKRIWTWVKRSGGLVMALVALASCRLYEPPRYQRLALGQGQAATRVLMVGDSLTYYNDLPGLLQQFSARESAPILIEQKTFPLRSLAGHLALDDSVSKIRDGHFDYVILQDFSDKPVTDFKGSLDSFLKFDAEIKKAGSKTVIFQNWIHKDAEDVYEPLEKAYREIVRQTGGIDAPIGRAWRLAARDRSDIKLLLDDRHPTDEGTYLAACVLYGVIYHKKSADLPEQLPGPKLSQSVMTALRSLADRAVAGN